MEISVVNGRTKNKKFVMAAVTAVVLIVVFSSFGALYGVKNLKAKQVVQ